MNFRQMLGWIAVGLFLSGCSSGISQAPANPTGLAPLGMSQQSNDSRIAANNNIRLFPTPTVISWPDYITKGSDGNVWFTEFYSDRVGRVTPSGAITEFPLPALNDVEGITSGPDGNLWFTEPGENKIGKMTTGGVVSTFPIKATDPSPRGITAGPDGNVWFVEFYDGAIGRITPAGVITRFTIPQGQSYPWWITTGKDGDLWFTESGNDLIGRFDPKTLKFKTPMRVPGKSVTPWGIMSAPDGRIWFTERTAGDIAVINTGGIQAFHISDPTSYPDTLVTGPDGDIWFTENQAGSIGHFNPTTGKFAPAIRLPSGDIPTGITVGGDGNIWFTVGNYYEQNSIGKIVLH